MPYRCAADTSAMSEAIMSIWTKSSEQCFQHMVESMTQRFKAVLKAKRRKSNPEIYKDFLINWLVFFFLPLSGSCWAEFKCLVLIKKLNIFAVFANYL